MADSEEKWLKRSAGCGSVEQYAHGRVAGYLAVRLSPRAMPVRVLS